MFESEFDVIVQALLIVRFSEVDLILEPFFFAAEADVIVSCFSPTATLVSQIWWSLRVLFVSLWIYWSAN